MLGEFDFESDMTHDGLSVPRCHRAPTQSHLIMLVVLLGLIPEHSMRTGTMFFVAHVTCNMRLSWVSLATDPYSEYE